MDTFNKFAVGVQGDKIIVFNIVGPARISKDEALNLAAWLVTSIRGDWMICGRGDVHGTRVNGLQRRAAWFRLTRRLHRYTCGDDDGLGGVGDLAHVFGGDGHGEDDDR